MANALQTLFTEIADSIRGGLPNEGKMSPNNFPKKIDEIVANGGTGGGSGGDSGGASVSSSDINFYDYDGTLVAAWTLDELSAATALPDNPSHAGLTAQGWNWTLADLKAANCPMNVGQMYITDNGKTRLYITLVAGGGYTVPLYINQTVENGVAIDWGDGSAAETVAGTGAVNTTHEYANGGDYVITLSPIGDCTFSFGDGSNTVLGTYNGTYPRKLQKIEIGSGMTGFDNFSVRHCYSLESITIPNSVTNIGLYAITDCYPLAFVTIPNSILQVQNNTFQNCYGLKTISIPNGVTTIGSGVFASCYSLVSVIIPASVKSFAKCFDSCRSLKEVFFAGGVTSIATEMFTRCDSLKSVTIPNSVTNFGDYCFSTTKGTLGIHIKATTPPSITRNTFGSITTNYTIYVPKGCLGAYQAATTWSDYASRMVEE